MVAAGTVMVVVRGGTAEAYSLDALVHGAQTTSTLSYELDTSMPDGTTIFTEVTMDIDHGLASMTMDDHADHTSKLIFDLDRSRVYVDAESYTAMGVDVGDAEWIEFDLDEMLDMDASTFYGQIGENPLDATLLFDSAQHVEDLGFDQVRGEQVKHYEVTVDEDDVFDLDLETSGFVNDGTPDPEGVVVYDVFVNESNQMVRLDYDVKVMDQYMSIELTVTGINEVVNIDVPDRSDVIGFDDVEF